VDDQLQTTRTPGALLFILFIPLILSIL